MWKNLSSTIFRTKYQHFLKYCLVISILSFWALPSIGQANLLQGKLLGIYISSSQFDLPQKYAMSTAQFLSVGENRSGVGNQKSELMIRLGELISRQLNGLAAADSIIFLNGDLIKGRAFRAMYDRETNKLKDTIPALSGIEMVLVINELDLGTRSHQTVFFRSNQMYTKKIEVKTAELSATLLDPYVPELAIQLSTCFDEYDSPKVPYHFNFYKADSKLGDFFSRLFSNWWQQMLDGIESNCE